MKFQTAYSDKPIIATENKQPSMTKQSLADDLDVNNIIRKYANTGVLQQATNFEAIYGDFTELDLRTAIEQVQAANKLFMEVPSNIRANFNNDPGAFIDFATNPDNIQQMRDWKLANPLQEVIPSTSVPPAPIT